MIAGHYARRIPGSSFGIRWPPPPVPRRESATSRRCAADPAPQPSRPGIPRPTSTVFWNRADSAFSTFPDSLLPAMPPWRARNRCSVSLRMPASVPSVPADETDGARPTMGYPCFSASAAPGPASSPAGARIALDAHYAIPGRQDQFHGRFLSLGQRAPVKPHITARPRTAPYPRTGHGTPGSAPNGLTTSDLTTACTLHATVHDVLPEFLLRMNHDTHTGKPSTNSA